MLKLIKIHGEAKWSLIAEKMPGRNRKQLREHFINYLKKETSEKCFTPSEDMLILKLVEQNGREWSKISDLMPGRAPQAIKNRYYSKLRRKNKEQTCLQITRGIPHIKSEANLESAPRTRGTCPTNERSSFNFSERNSNESELNKRRTSIKGRNSIKPGKGQFAREQIDALLKKKEELQNALDVVAKKIQSMELSMKDDSH